MPSPSPGRTPVSPYRPGCFTIVWTVVLVVLSLRFHGVLGVLTVACLIFMAGRTILVSYRTEASLSAVDCWAAGQKARIDTWAAHEKAMIDQRAEHLRQLARDRPHATYRYLKKTGWLQRYLPTKED